MRFAPVLFESDSDEGFQNTPNAFHVWSCWFFKLQVYLTEFQFIFKKINITIGGPLAGQKAQFMHLAKIAFATCTETELPPGNPQT